ncbi:MAG: hypothetical protein RIS52_1120 [Pseudomonadota bacterium]
MVDSPPALADLTPQFLTGVLRSHGFVTNITDVTVQPIGTGQVGATYRLTLAQTGNGPATLVAKLPSNDPLSKATGKSHLTYIRESRFYQCFAGKKPMPVPQHLLISFDEESHDFALLMHDLPRHRAGNQLESPTQKEAMLAMEAAASIHAAWWDDPILDTLDWLNGTKAVPPPLDTNDLYSFFWPQFCDRYGARVTPLMRRVGEAYLGKVGQWQDGQSGPRCLTHNDFRPDNMLFDLEDAIQPIVIVDWQTVGVGIGAGDIAYYMGTALESETRAGEEVALFAHYCSALRAKNVPEHDIEPLWDIYRKSSFSGFLMGATAAMVVQQTERGDAMFLTMCARSAAMVLDHGAVALPQ